MQLGHIAELELERSHERLRNAVLFGRVRENEFLVQAVRFWQDRDRARKRIPEHCPYAMPRPRRSR